MSRIIVLGRASRRTMIQNLWWATGYNVVALPLAAGMLASRGIILSPAVGAVLVSASTVIVALNAQLLQRTKLARWRAAGPSGTLTSGKPCWTPAICLTGIGWRGRVLSLGPCSLPFKFPT